MANTFAPFGFMHVGRVDGAAPNYAATWTKISKSNSTAIYFGDPVTQLSTGYITQSTAGTTQIKGILIEVTYLGTTPGWLQAQKWWPGSNAAQDPKAAVITDPGAKFQVQANGVVPFTAIGQNINFAIGTGTVLGGIGTSGASVDVATIATTSTHPFRILGFAQGAPGVNGFDTTTAYPILEVTFNNSDLKSLTGI